MVRITFVSEVATTHNQWCRAHHEKRIVFICARYCPYFMKPECSLPCSLNPTPSQFSPVYTLTTHFFKIHFNTVLTSIRWFPNDLFSSYYLTIRFSSHPSVLHTPLLSSRLINATNNLIKNRGLLPDTVAVNLRHWNEIHSSITDAIISTCCRDITARPTTGRQAPRPVNTFPFPFIHRPSHHTHTHTHDSPTVADWPG